MKFELQNVWLNPDEIVLMDRNLILAKRLPLMPLHFGNGQIGIVSSHKIIYVGQYEECQQFVLDWYYAQFKDNELDKPDSTVQ